MILLAFENDGYSWPIRLIYILFVIITWIIAGISIKVKDKKEEKSMNKESYELKPCPFCGGSVDIKITNKYYDETYFLISTSNDKNACNCGVFMEGRKFDVDNENDKIRAKTELITKWNERAYEVNG